MKLIKTADAVGTTLCHDITRIVRGETKGPAFRKGHVVKEEDVQILLSLGKENIYIWEDETGMMHENDAAEALCGMCRGANIARSEAKEGKIELSSMIDGLFKVNKEKMDEINALGQMIIAVRHGNFPVKAGDVLAGVRIIPLAIEESRMSAAKQLCSGSPILNVIPLKRKKVGVITTGSEVFHGRIADTFTPVIKEKLSEYGVDILKHAILGDDHEKITGTCIEMIDSGMDLVICTGGMSVDPDDRTPLAIQNTGAEVVSYGAPVLPGAMFMLAYYGGENTKIPIIGLPGCVMYAERTIFDLVLPRILADDPISAKDLSLLGHGGLCLSCTKCVFPNCGFGKGR
ncbi:MAG: molybdopterin-binding protein [Synergistaceae bacterium]|nr:molybdopterin-binding protein [Synergistaceae bacterium]